MSHILTIVAPDFGVHPWWYLGRAGGFLAYTLLCLSMVLGIGISSRVFDGLLARGWFFELHKFLSLMVTGAIFFHAFIMLPDPFAGFSVADLLIPFWAGFKPLPLALGILGFYGSLILTLSSYVTKWIGQKTWRSLHYLAFFVYVGGAVHGVLAGTDTDALAAQVFYLGTGMSLIFFVFYRLLALRSQKAPAKTPVEKKRAPAPISGAEGKLQERHPVAG